MKKLAQVLIIIALANFSVPSLVSQTLASEITSFADIVEPLMPAVVNIYTVKYNKKMQVKSNPFSQALLLEELEEFFRQFGMPFAFDLYTNSRAISLGSGFIIDETGLIVTNNHVIAGSDEIHVKLSDNTDLPAIVVGRDPKTDLALIKIDADQKLPFVSFGDSAKARVGDIVIAIGNSLGFGGTVTTGIMSSKGRDLGSGTDELVDDFLQTDATINVGNSGGPLFDINGKVIGVNTAIPAVGGGVNVGIGFAIPSNRVQSIIAQLEQDGKISRGRLDIAIQEMTKELSEALNLGQSYGVLVVDIKAGGSGDKAGLKSGDLITEFNGKQVLNARKLQLFVAETKVNDEIALTVIRDKKTITLKAKIVEVKDEEPETILEDITYAAPQSKNLLEKSGVVFTDLTSDLRERFNIDQNITGLLVVEVKGEDNTLDLKLGDIVLSFNQETITGLEQFNGLYEKLKSDNKKTAILLIKRKDFSMFVVLPIK